MKVLLEFVQLIHDDHLYRTDSGSIMWKTALGKWMATKAFKFDERERLIVCSWNLNG